MDVVSFTKSSGPNGYLGNMTQFSIVRDGVLWPTAEHLFQSMRLPKGHVAVEQMLASSNPMSAKFVAKAAADDFVVEPLSEADLDNMRLVVRLKFEQHLDLAASLLGTGDARIVEDVSARVHKGAAMFWGAANLPFVGWVGLNWLGRILEERRDILRSERLF